MCGIAGFINLQKVPAERKFLNKMLQTIKHRGLDDSGSFVKKNVALGIRRLAIIDVMGGNQPIFNEDRTVAVVFNGEIYNFKLLRGFLIKKGHIFKTKSDTEVIIHLYEEKAESLFE